MNRQRMKKNNGGFTLIETTVAMLVMMVVGLGATSLFLYSVRYNSGASQRSIAMAVAQQRLEVLRGANYSDAELSFGLASTETAVATGTTTTFTSGTTLPAATAGSSYFQLQTQVVPFPIGVSAATAKQKQITIRVVPINGNGNSSWVNNSPIQIVFHRSSNAPGPYKQ